MTAELATALPALVLVFAACCNGISALAVKVSLSESSFSAARQLARGEVPHAPGTVTRTDGLVCVEHARVVGLLPVSARSCVLDERGGGSVLVLGLVAGLLSLTMAVALALGVNLRSVEVALAADAAALAAASTATGLVGGEPCELAARVAASWSVELAACACDRLGECRVRAQATVAGGGLSANARAGAR